jgi:Tfp pilus tip-associated adhesin PilY1
LRYSTGDIAEGGLTWEKCPNSGRTCPRLLGPITRVSEVKELHIDKLKGTLVNFNDDDTKRYVTGDAIDWATKKGWVMPFNVSSEMGLNNMTIANSQLLTVSVSPAPAKTGADSDPCTDTPVARLLGVDPVTGLPNGLLGSVEVIDPSKPLQRDSAIPNYMTMLLASIPVADQKGAFVGDLVGRGSTQAGCANGSLACTAYEGATSDGEPVRFATGLSSGRIFWREIPGFKTR